MNIVVLHGPNLNMLGERNPEVYGVLDLNQINERIQSFCKDQGLNCTIYQSNAENEMVDYIQKSTKNTDAIIINAAAYTHTSIAIRDAIELISVPVIEVHLSHIYSRESFRQQSMIAPVCNGQITGFGWYGYVMAIQYLIHSE